MLIVFILKSVNFQIYVLGYKTVDLGEIRLNIANSKQFTKSCVSWGLVKTFILAFIKADLLMVWWTPWLLSWWFLEFQIVIFSFVYFAFVDPQEFLENKSKYWSRILWGQSWPWVPHASLCIGLASWGCSHWRTFESYSFSYSKEYWSPIETNWRTQSYPIGHKRMRSAPRERAGSSSPEPVSGLVMVKRKACLTLEAFLL